MDLNDKTERVKRLHKKGKDSLYIQKHLGVSLKEIETILSPSFDNPVLQEVNKFISELEQLEQLPIRDFKLGVETLKTNWILYRNKLMNKNEL